MVKSGKVLYLGISDTPAWIVSAANEYAKSHGKTQFSIYQGRWNVMLRDFERDILPMARHYGMALAPWDAIVSFSSHAYMPTCIHAYMHSCIHACMHACIKYTSGPPFTDTSLGRRKVPDQEAAGGAQEEQ